MYRIRFCCFLLSSTLALLTGISEPVFAQIEVAPVRVYLTSRQRDMELLVTNPLDETVEATASFGFKMLRSDSLGNRRLDSLVADSELAYSCRKWLKLYPAKLVLPPGATRSIRIIAMPPNGLPNGEYWARLEIIGERMGSPTAPATDTNGVVIDLRMRLNVGIPVTFRKGEVETGIEIGDVLAQRLDSACLLLVDTKRLGNAVYRGTLRAVVRGADGGDLFKGEREFTNETILRNALKLPILPEGKYDLSIESETVRDGSMKEMVVAAPTVRKDYALQITGSEIRLLKKE